MSQTHTQRRASSYYFRRKVPADLIGHFGTREIVRSLKTMNLREASALRYEQGHYWVQEFARVRAGGLQGVPRKEAEAQGLLEALSALPTPPRASQSSRVGYGKRSSPPSRCAPSHTGWRNKARPLRVNAYGAATAVKLSGLYASLNKNAT